MSGEYGLGPLPGFENTLIHRLDSRADADLATLPMTVLQLKAVFGFGARPLRLD